MKKALPLIVFFSFIAAIANAQINKGSVLLGGGISFSHSKSGVSYVYKEGSVFVNPVVGVAVKPNFVIGISGLYGHSNLRSDSTSTPPQSNAEGGSIFLRRYFPLGKNFYLYGQGSIGYRHDHSKIEESDYYHSDETNTINLSVAPGLAYAISRKFHLEIGLSDLLAAAYGRNKTVTYGLGIGGVQTTKSNFFNLSSSLNPTSGLYLGFRVLLAK